MNSSTQQRPEIGQVWTPYEQAERVVSDAISALGREPMHCVDAGCGPGVFTQALSTKTDAAARISSYEIDPILAEQTARRFQADRRVAVHHSDYLLTKVDAADLVVMNPPYLRHERIPPTLKSRYLKGAKKSIGRTLSRRSNLLAYFLAKGYGDLRPGGVLAAYLYDSAFQTQYGLELRRILESKSEIIEEQTVESPFEDVLIDARVLIIAKLTSNPAPANSRPSNRRKTGTGWAPISDLLEARRGLGLNYRRAFIAKKDDPFFDRATPMIFKHADASQLVAPTPPTRAYVFERDEPDLQLKEFVARRLDTCEPTTYKLHHPKITGPILFNYFVRSNPRHILNHRRYCASDNFYVSFPRHGIGVEFAWFLLNSPQYLNAIMLNARAQGHGLKKLQLTDYLNAEIPDWRLASEASIRVATEAARRYVRSKTPAHEIQRAAQEFVESHLGVGT